MEIIFNDCSNNMEISFTQRCINQLKWRTFLILYWSLNTTELLFPSKDGLDSTRRGLQVMAWVSDCLCAILRSAWQFLLQQYGEHGISSCLFSAPKLACLIWTCLQSLQINAVLERTFCLVEKATQRLGGRWRGSIYLKGSIHHGCWCQFLESELQHQCASTSPGYDLK